MIASSPGGNFARSFSAAGIVPVSTQREDLLLQRPPMPGSSVARPSRASAATETDASRTALRGRAVGEHAVDDRAVELVQVAEFLERIGDRGVRQLGLAHGLQSRAPAAARARGPRRLSPTLARVRRPMSGEPWLILPTYNEAENIEAIVAAAGEVLARRGARRAFAC